MAADGLLGWVAEEPFGRGVPALNDTVERLADDGVVGRLDDRREQPGRHAAGWTCPVPDAACAVTSRKIRTHPETWPRSSLIGAALSSIGHSMPSFRISSVWFASPTTTPSRNSLGCGVLDRVDACPR